MMIRPAVPDDANILARIHVAGWQASYGGLVDQKFLDSLDVNEREKNWIDWMKQGDTSVLIADDSAGKPMGFISFGRLRTPPPGGSPIRPLYTAEVYAIYLLPESWGQGVGRGLMAAAAVALKDRKHKSLCLWVLEGNKRAIAFYRALGGQKCGSKIVEIGGRNLPEIAFGWRDTAALASGAKAAVDTP